MSEPPWLGPLPEDGWVLAGPLGLPGGRLLVRLAVGLALEGLPPDCPPGRDPLFDEVPLPAPDADEPPLAPDALRAADEPPLAPEPEVLPDLAPAPWPSVSCLAFYSPRVA